MPSRHKRLAESLLASREEIARRVATEHLGDHPELLDRFGEAGRIRCVEDANFHVQYLANALLLGSATLFAAYAQWARQLLEQRHIPWSDLQRNLELLRDEVARDLGEDDAAVVREYVDAALHVEPLDAESFLSSTPRGALARAYLTALLRSDRRTAIAIIDDAVRTGVSIRDLYLDVFQPVQREIGRLWQSNELTVAQEHYCTASTQAMMAQFYPQILATPRVGRKVVVACVGSELHEIGTRMVADFFEMEGWDGVYVGASTPSNALVDLVCREHPNLVAVGITMTYHLATATELIERLRSDPRCGGVKIIAGGYLFQQDSDLWRNLGVDGCAPDAAAAVVIGNQLVDESRSRQ